MENFGLDDWWALDVAENPPENQEEISMPKIVVEIKWDYPDEPFWLNADNVKIALAAYCKNTAFDVVELVTEDEPWAEMRFEWASLINSLACHILDGICQEAIDLADDAILKVVPYLGLAEE